MKHLFSTELDLYQYMPESMLLRRLQLQSTHTKKIKELKYSCNGLTFANFYFQLCDIFGEICIGRHLIVVAGVIYNNQEFCLARHKVFHDRNINFKH